MLIRGEGADPFLPPRLGKRLFYWRIELSNALVLTPLNGEPRIHDLLLAEQLGFEEPRSIRKLIKRNEEKLIKFGPRVAMSRVTITGQS